MIPISRHTINGINHASWIFANGKCAYTTLSTLIKLKSFNICNKEIIYVAIVGMIKLYFISNEINILNNEISTNTIDVG